FEIKLNRNVNAALLAGIALDAEAQGARSASQQIKQLNVHLQFASAADAPLSLDIHGQGINGQQLDAEHFDIGVTGTTQQHTLSATLVERDQSWKLAANGGLQNLTRIPGWQGSITALDAQGQLELHLNTPADLRISQQEVQLEHLQLA